MGYKIKIRFLPFIWNISMSKWGKSNSLSHHLRNVDTSSRDQTLGSDPVTEETKTQIQSPIPLFLVYLMTPLPVPNDRINWQGYGRTQSLPSLRYNTIAI
jgi:hypothetical protein